MELFFCAGGWPPSAEDWPDENFAPRPCVGGLTAFAQVRVEFEFDLRKGR